METSLRLSELRVKEGRHSCHELFLTRVLSQRGTNVGFIYVRGRTFTYKGHTMRVFPFLGLLHLLLKGLRTLFNRLVVGELLGGKGRHLFLHARPWERQLVRWGRHTRGRVGQVPLRRTHGGTRHTYYASRGPHDLYGNVTRRVVMWHVHVRVCIGFRFRHFLLHLFLAFVELRRGGEAIGRGHPLGGCTCTYYYDICCLSHF